MVEFTPSRIVISEIFNSLQGEGPDTGKPTTFLRLMGCNLKCSWCDTAYTWDASRFDLKAEATSYSVIQLAEEIDRWVSVTDRLDITGGEPLLQGERLATLLHRLKTRPYIEMETNGTVMPNGDLKARVHRFNVSPKLEHSGNGLERIDISVLNYFAGIAERYGQAIFKFVMDSPRDISEVEYIVAMAGIKAKHVWLMPRGETSEALQSRMPWLAEVAMQKGWSLTGRQHVNAFYGARGR